MNTSTRSAAVAVAAIALALPIAACGEESTPSSTSAPTTTTAAPTTTTQPDQPAGLSDGEWFGLVTIDTTGGSVRLVVDPAEMLTGQEAHDAAVEAGVITEDEVLPNDFFIANPDSQTYLIPIAPDATITVLSGEAVDRTLTVSAGDLASIFDGTYQGEVVYGIVPGIQVPFDVTVVDGAATAITQVYTP